MKKTRQAIDVDALWRIRRLAGLSASPDGRRVACSVTSWSMRDNRAVSQLWLLSTHGGAPRQLTSCGERDAQPRWSPDGRLIAFVARRGSGDAADKTPQPWVIAADGGEARRVGSFAPGVQALRWMPDSRRLIGVAWVWPDARGAAAQNRRWRDEAARKESGYATSQAQYRYWSENLPAGRVARLLTFDITDGRVRDLFDGTPYELPRDEPGVADFDVSPDGRRIVFRFDPAPQKAGGNRCVLLEMDLRTRRVRTLADHAGWSFAGPRYSRDGSRIAAVASAVGTRHTAFGQLALWPVGRAWREDDVRGWQHDVSTDLVWSADGSAIFFSAEQEGRCHAWRHDVAGGGFTLAARGGWVQALDLAGPAGDETLVTLDDAATHPGRVHALRDGQRRRIESFNDELLERLAFGRVEERWITGAQGDRVQLWLTYPVGFDAKKKHPVLHVIHGGPYTAAGDSFGYRWNAHLLASRGHVVVQLNYHGSSGFGEAFRDAIVGRQGQLEMQDLQAAVDWVAARRWADARRTYAAGASYGGYLVAWLNGHWKPWPDGPIRAYVCHAGVFDRVATWSADSYTQRHRDLGATYWADRERVESQSPHRYAAAMDTPTLVIHGALDYRVPDHNGLAYYNTLKARGVDARLLWFLDEHHWVLKPRNARQWIDEVFGWLERHGGKRRGGGSAAV